MSNKFLGATNAGNLANGASVVHASTLGATSLKPSYPVKTNSLRQLVSSKLNISDINNLQDTLDNVSATNLNVITTPYTGSPNKRHPPPFREIEASSFKKTGGSAIQYLMANGSTLTQSANSGNSNFYLYNSSTGDPPIVDGDVK